MFNVALSQFSKEQSYVTIRKNILKNLIPYSGSIKKCRYSGVNIYKFAELTLKYRLVFAIYLAYIYKKAVTIQKPTLFIGDS